MPVKFASNLRTAKESLRAGTSDIPYSGGLRNLTSESLVPHFLTVNPHLI